MNSRERTFKALKHEPVDRIPIDFWATAAVIKKLEDKLEKPYEQILEDYDVDLRYIEGPTYIGTPLATDTDIWGVIRRSVKSDSSANSESYSEVTKAPLSDAETVADIEAYPHWPNPDMFDYSVIEQQCDAILAKDRIVVFMGDRLNRIAQFKPAMYLRGTENIFIDLAANKEIAEAIFRKIKEFYLIYLENILNAAKGKIDIILTGDDFGAQNGLLIGADMWREFIKPGFAEYLNMIRNNDTISMHHSCGAVTDIIPDFIDCKLDVLQSIQPETEGMSLSNLKKLFGKEISFQGGISIQETMPYGSPDDVRNAVKDIANIIKPDGGYIFCTSHNIQADTSTKNVIALLEAYLKYGKY